MSNDQTTSSSGRQIIDIILPTYILQPDEKEKFYPSRVKSIAEEVLREELDGKVDDKWIEDWEDFGEDFEALSKDIVNNIKDKCKKVMDIPRYKIIVQVSIGQMKDQGVCISSRCLWATSTDNYTSASYQNQYIWASAIVFALYTD